MRARSAIVICSVALVAGVLSAGPASAIGAPIDESASLLTFTVNAGTLDITTPASVDLGTAVVGTITSSLGPVTVSDTRRAADATWTVSVSAREFWGDVTDISADSMTYWSGEVTETTGSGTFTPGQATADSAEAFGNGGFTAFSHVAGTGVNVATWAPTISVSIPLQALPGNYWSEAYHSVS